MKNQNLIKSASTKVHPKLFARGSKTNCTNFLDVLYFSPHLNLQSGSNCLFEGAGAPVGRGGSTRPEVKSAPSSSSIVRV